jgi:hypothetical protein
MPAERKPPLLQPPLPSLSRADRRGVIEQPVFLLLLGQPGEPGVERVAGWQERLLAMEDGRVGAVGIVIAVELAGAERQLDAAKQGRMRVGRELGINEVRNLPRMPMQLDQVRPLDLAQITSGRSRSREGISGRYTTPVRGTRPRGFGRRGEISRMGRRWRSS